MPMCAAIPAAARVSPVAARVNEWLDGCSVLRGGPGDHGAAFQLLSSVFKGNFSRAPSRDSFFASLDDPFYEPNDRILVRRGLRVLAQTQVSQRTVQFGGMTLPVSGLHALCTLPEFRRQGFAGALVQMAQEVMLEDGAVFGSLATNEPHFFRAHGWVVCGRQSLARAHTRHVLAQLSARGVPAASDMPHIRPLRQVELPSVMSVYAAATRGRHGPLERTEAYWRWLVSRGGYDQIFVAMGGSDRKAWDDFNSPVVGYVTVKDNRILELITLPSIDGEFNRDQIAEQLLSRACHEAIERDLHVVQFHAWPGESLFNLFRVAGGEIFDREQFLGEVSMVNLFDPAGFVTRFAPELQRRVSDVKSGVELGLSIEGEKSRLVVNKRGVKLRPGPLGRDYLRLSQAEFVRLLLGHDGAANALVSRRMHASSRQARVIAAQLFPDLAYWRSPWDELYL